MDPKSGENGPYEERHRGENMSTGTEMESCCVSETVLGVSIAVAACCAQWCLTLCDPIDGSPPGSPVPGILQARTLEWVAMSFSNA